MTNIVNFQKFVHLVTKETEVKSIVEMSLCVISKPGVMLIKQIIEYKIVSIYST